MILCFRMHNATPLFIKLICHVEIKQIKFCMLLGEKARL